MRRESDCEVSGMLGAQPPTAPHLPSQESREGMKMEFGDKKKKLCPGLHV